MGDRRAEHRHDAVAHVLVDMAAMLVDDAVRAGEELPKQCMDFLRIQLPTHRRKTRQVGEEYGYLAPLADLQAGGRRDSGALRGGLRRGWFDTQRGNGIEQLAAMADLGNAEFLEA